MVLFVFMSNREVLSLHYEDVVDNERRKFKDRKEILVVDFSKIRKGGVAIGDVLKKL